METSLYVTKETTGTTTTGDTYLLCSSGSRNRRSVRVTKLGESLDLQVNSGKTAILSGPWPLQVKLQERPVTTSSWEEICTHQDEDVDYLELESRIGRGWRVQRQIVLARKERFLLLCDTVIGSTVRAIDYQTVLPMSNGIHVQREEETTEMVLNDEGKIPLASVIPLSLHEWRQGNRNGSIKVSIEQNADGLFLAQRNKGKGLFASVFVDLHPSRFGNAVTWRQLTVAENFAIQPADVAAGYRLQSGRKQWLVYRSLAPAASRTILGQNFTAEFVVARFNARGYTEIIIEVEQELDSEPTSTAR